MTEAESYGMLREGNGFPEDFDLTTEIDSYRFCLMCKMRYNNELFDKKYFAYLEDLRNRLMASSGSKKFTDKTMNQIINSAYNTISDTFFTEYQKKV